MTYTSAVLFKSPQEKMGQYLFVGKDAKLTGCIKFGDPAFQWDGAYPSSKQFDSELRRNDPIQLKAIHYT